MATRISTRPESALDFERKPFYSPAEVAKILSISDQTVLERIHEGRLFAVQLGVRLYRIPLGALLQFMGAQPSIRRSVNPQTQVNRKTDDPQDAAEH